MIIRGANGGFTEQLYYADGLNDEFYNGNISTMKWKGASDNSCQGYNLEYDENNRLTSATFGTGDNLTGSKGYFNESAEYDGNGNIINLKRGGLVNKMYGGFGLVDNLTMTYDGNRLMSVRDDASRHTYTGATDFDGVKGQEYPLTYNEAGALVSDAGRRIARIDYDAFSNPIRIQFTNGNVTKYIYSATGEKLRVVYQTAVPNLSVPIGETRELSPSEILNTNYTDYLLGGSLTLNNGRIDKYYFEEGYCQAEANYQNDYFTFYYFNQDHLGNIRQVIEATGSAKVIQNMNYYPFGAEFCDGNTKNYNQKRKYNGKEFDNMHGLNTYDYGARQYNPVTARWDRMDPLAEKYPGVSPYAYCVGNPVITIDPDGKEGVVVHGTWSDNSTWKNIAELEIATKNLFDDANISYGFTWSGGNSTEARSAAAKGLVDKLKRSIANGEFKDNEPITLIGHSHGGNVIIEAVNQMVTMEDFEGRKINVLTINTPVRSDYQLSKDAQESPFVTHVNVYDSKDPVQVVGGKIENFGIAGRTFPNARNIKVNNPQGLLETKLVNGYDANSHSTATYPILTIGDFHNSHNRVKTWINQTRKR